MLFDHFQFFEMAMKTKVSMRLLQKDGGPKVTTCGECGKCSNHISTSHENQIAQWFAHAGNQHEIEDILSKITIPYREEVYQSFLTEFKKTDSNSTPPLPPIYRSTKTICYKPRFHSIDFILSPTFLKNPQIGFFYLQLLKHHFATVNALSPDAGSGVPIRLPHLHAGGGCCFPRRETPRHCNSHR